LLRLAEEFNAAGSVKRLVDAISSVV